MSLYEKRSRNTSVFECKPFKSNKNTGFFTHDGSKNDAQTHQNFQKIYPSVNASSKNVKNTERLLILMIFNKK